MKSFAIAHEGTEDKNFAELILSDLKLDIAQVEFYRFGSKSNFFKHDHPLYQRLKSRHDADQITKILFIVDADDEETDEKYGGLNNTTIEINAILEELSLSQVSDLYVACDPATQKGYIESLILSSISETQRVCIESFLSCSEFNSKQNHKAILNQIYKMAYPNSPYDLKNPCFNTLKQKIAWLFA